MHAASVHPEPGSNSLIFSIDRPFGLPYQCLFLEPFGSCSLTCKSLFIFLQKNFRSLCTCSSRAYASVSPFPNTVVFVVQFSRIPPPHRTACLLYHTTPPLSIPFSYLFFFVNLAQPTSPFSLLRICRSHT